MLAMAQLMMERGSYQAIQILLSISNFVQIFCQSSRSTLINSRGLCKTNIQ